ncbi:10948_t:CDS:2 [Diversispora eburnea]|uniref:10948_t:CDS:1 n=1 Tax=Diversispora eburnea TaxID=1213867 RepID=A0A9N8ZWA5_9GLOM|nr:10948_t:CDS:2 [Diversispora eburnea]
MSLVAMRERRANAGSRMRELIEREMELEEMFQEVADDRDFTEENKEEEVDDSDIEQSSSESEESNEDTVEKDILLEEKQTRKKARKSQLPPALKKREVNKSKVSSKERAQNNQSEPMRYNSDKKKKVTLQTPLLLGIRSSSRTHTVQSKQMLAEKLKQYEEKRVVVRPKTQEELLMQAKETEEKNLASLRAFELREAEKKVAAKQYKKVFITGPCIRKISYVDDGSGEANKRLKLITEVPKKGNKEGKGKGILKEPKNVTSSESSVENKNDKLEDILEDIIEVDDIVEDKVEDSVEDKVKDNIEDSVKDKIKDNVDDKDKDDQVEDKGEENKVEDKREARNLVIFSQFSRVEENKLFQEWRKKPQKAKKVICPFTGLIAKYKDPKTGIPYANVEAYSRIRNLLLKHKYVWSHTYSAYINNTDQSPAKGISSGFQ